MIILLKQEYKKNHIVFIFELLIYVIRKVDQANTSVNLIFQIFVFFHKILTQIFLRKDIEVSLTYKS